MDTNTIDPIDPLRLKPRGSLALGALTRSIKMCIFCFRDLIPSTRSMSFSEKSPQLRHKKNCSCGNSGQEVWDDLSSCRWCRSSHIRFLYPQLRSINCITAKLSFSATRPMLRFFDRDSVGRTPKSRVVRVNTTQMPRASKHLEWHFLAGHVDSARFKGFQRMSCLQQKGLWAPSCLPAGTRTPGGCKIRCGAERGPAISSKAMDVTRIKPTKFFHI